MASGASSSSRETRPWGGRRHHHLAAAAARRLALNVFRGIHMLAIEHRPNNKATNRIQRVGAHHERTARQGVRRELLNAHAIEDSHRLPCSWCHQVLRWIKREIDQADYLPTWCDLRCCRWYCDPRWREVRVFSHPQAVRSVAQSMISTQLLQPMSRKPVKIS